MNKKLCLEEVARRGYFKRSDADRFGKAAVTLTASQMQRLGIEPEDAGSHFYTLNAFDVEPEDVQAGLGLGFNVVDKGNYTIISLL
ncbi:MAG: hypothetical protein ACOC78_03125 [Actinomycetota bacterium]